MNKAIDFQPSFFIVHGRAANTAKLGLTGSTAKASTCMEQSHDTVSVDRSQTVRCRPLPDEAATKQLESFTKAKRLIYADEELARTLIISLVDGFHSVINSAAPTARIVPSEENAAANIGFCL